MKTKDVKSVEDWRDVLNQDSRHGRGRFRILTRELFNSPAFAELGGSATIVVLAVLNKLEYERKGKKDRKGVKVGLGVIRNNGEFVLTINELVARGLSRSSATRARNRAWELGFFDVLAPGTIHHSGRYRYSERWRLYPFGKYKPVGQQSPGKNVYPENGFKQAQQAENDSALEHEERVFPEYLKVVEL